MVYGLTFLLVSRLCSKENYQLLKGAHHMICMKNLRFSSRPGAKVRRQGPPGSARAQPWVFVPVYISPIC